MTFYADDFNRANTASGLGATSTGGGVWVNRVGSAQISNGRPVFTKSGTLAVAVIASGSPDSDQTVDANGGDALYARVSLDGLSWVRARVRRFTTTSTSTVTQPSTTEYLWKADSFHPSQGSNNNTGWHTNDAGATQGQTAELWSSSSTSSPFPSGSFSQEQGHSHNGTQGFYTHSHSYTVLTGSAYYTGSTRQVGGGTTTTTSTQTNYQVIIERSAAGTVTVLSTTAVSTPSRLRFRVVGTTAAVFTGATPILRASVNVPAFTPTASTGHGIGVGPSDVTVSILDTWQLDTLNTAPNAPILVSPASGATIARTTPTLLDWNFSDPDPGDTQSKAEVRYRLSGAAWTTVAVNSPVTSLTVAAGTFVVGDFEWQVLTFDQSGLPSPWSASGFFTAVTPPPGPTILAPVQDGTIGSETSVLSWSTTAQDTYQVRILGDLSGAADEAAVLYDTGTVASASARNAVLTHPANGRVEHLQVRTFSGLWSPWSSVRVTVSYTPPAEPPAPAVSAATVTDVLGRQVFASALTLAWFQPFAEGTPEVVTVDVYKRRTDGRGEYGTDGIRIAKDLVPEGTFTDYRVAGGVEYEYRLRAAATNGTSSWSEWATTLSEDSIARSRFLAIP